MGQVQIESFASEDAFVKVHATSPAFSFDFEGKVRSKARELPNLPAAEGRVVFKAMRVYRGRPSPALSKLWKMSR